MRGGTVIGTSWRRHWRRTGAGAQALVEWQELVMPGVCTLRVAVPQGWNARLGRSATGGAEVRITPESGPPAEVSVKSLAPEKAPAVKRTGRDQGRGQDDGRGGVCATSVEKRVVLERVDGTDGAGFFYSLTDNRPSSRRGEAAIPDAGDHGDRPAAPRRDRARGRAGLGGAGDGVRPAAHGGVRRAPRRPGNSPPAARVHLRGGGAWQRCSRRCLSLMALRRCSSSRGPRTSSSTGLGGELGKPRAILCVSAHWEAGRTDGFFCGQARVRFTTSPGSRRNSIASTYPAAGDPGLAARVVELLRGRRACRRAATRREASITAPGSRSASCTPDADVPVVQLSVQTRLGARHHLELGRALAPLRSDGVLIFGSGGATHDLREYFGGPADAHVPAYVAAFEGWLCEGVTSGAEGALVDFIVEGPDARRNHPTQEHFLPIFVPLGAAASPRGRILHRGFDHGVLSLAAFAWD